MDGILVKSNPKRIRKIQKKTSVVESSLVLCRLLSLQLYKQGLCYDWFHIHDEFSEDFQNGIFIKTAWDGCFYTFNLTAQDY